MKRIREPFLILRIMLAISCLSPLFIFLSIKGSQIFPTKILLIACAAIIIVPFIFIELRYRAVIKNSDIEKISIQSCEDSRDHLLVYLFAVLVPLYQADIDSIRQILLLMAVLSFVIFLFVHLELYYTNIFFAARGLKIYTLTTLNGKRIALLSSKKNINLTSIQAIRMSNFLYLDAGDHL